jgi:hypothetical protein
MSEIPCPYCSETIPEDSVKCPECGEFLDEQEAPSSGGSSAVLIVIIVVASLMALCAIAAIVAAIAIPNLIEARKAGNEAAAIGALKTIGTAQALFREGDKDADELLDYGDLYEIGQSNLIDQVLASGMKQGYIFDVQPSATTPEFLWMATAEPAAPGTTGDRYFATNHEGVIWYSNTAPIALDDEGCVIDQARVTSGDIRPVGK